MTAVGGARGGGAAWRWLLPLIGAIVLTVVLVPSRPERRPYDLSSTEADGYRGLDLLLDRFGADVTEIDAEQVDGSLARSRDVVFVPEGDGVGRDLADRLRAFAEAGGRVVLGAPSDWIGATAVDPAGFEDPTGIGSEEFPIGSPGWCNMDDLAGGEAIELPVFVLPLDVTTSDLSCYGDGDAAFVVRRNGPDGPGELIGRDIVTLAGPGIFSNELMGAPAPEEPVGEVPDNGLLAQRLVGEVGGRPARVAVVTEGLAAAVGSGEKSFADYMSAGVKLGILELAVAVAILAVARGRRHGRIVAETPQVEIAGSAFVEAVGSLLERQGDVGRAADAVRAGHRRELSRRLGLHPGAAATTVAAAAAARTGREPAEVLALLTAPVETETELLTMTRELDSLRQEASHV